MELKDKNIIITGGSLGIGKQTAISLHEKGANVLVTGRSEKRLKTSMLPDKINKISFDIGHINEIEINAKKCLNFFDNRVDVLINNAGIGFKRNIDELSIDDFMKIYNVNVFGLSLFTKEIVSQMKNAKYGTIVNIGSTAALKGYSGGSIYSSSKFALRCLTQCWQSELRPFNIRVCQLNPSEVTTAFGSIKRVERNEEKNKLTPREIAHSVISLLEMNDRGFVNELNVWATNPFN